MELAMRPIVATAGIQRMMEVSALQRPNALHQVAERPGERMRNKEDQCAAHQNRRKAQQ
jgi:hypothetical protein